jgi:hypothetical protein
MEIWEPSGPQRAYNGTTLSLPLCIIFMEENNEGNCAKIRGSKGAEKMTFIARVIQPAVSINHAKFIDL